MDVNALHERLLAHFGPEIVLGLTPAAGGIRDAFITVAGHRIDKVCLLCRVESDLRFDFCQSITGLDAGESFLCVYHLYSYAHRHSLVLKVTTPREAPRLPSCVSVWPAADWYEREIYDLFGVVFEGHPDLRRLLLPEEWPGHPMRKDWKESPMVLGMPTTRENTLDLLGPAEEAT